MSNPELGTMRYFVYTKTWYVPHFILFIIAKSLIKTIKSWMNIFSWFRHDSGVKMWPPGIGDSTSSCSDESSNGGEVPWMMGLDLVNTMERRLVCTSIWIPMHSRLAPYWTMTGRDLILVKQFLVFPNILPFCADGPRNTNATWIILKVSKYPSNVYIHAPQTCKVFRHYGWKIFIFSNILSQQMLKIYFCYQTKNWLFINCW